MSLKTNRHVLLWSFIIYIFAFQRTLTDTSIIFSYIDEVFAILALLCIIFSCVKSKNVLTRTEYLILVLLFTTLLVGVIGNVMSGVLTDPYYIFVDALSMIKVWLAYYALVLTDWRRSTYDKLIISLAKIGRVLVWIMLGCLVVSQFTDIGMTASARFGIKSFQFVFNVPGNFSKLFYFLIPLFTADLNYKSSRYKKTMISLALLVWASTMRTRAFAFIAAYLIMAVFFFKSNSRRWGEILRKKIKITYVIPIVVIAIIISWNQLIFYFTTDTQARSVLLRYGIMTMITYFPIGAGLGTFGSDVASTHYSTLYAKYGFNAIYGMRQGEEYFLNDNYWPMVMGQVGIIGTLLILAALYKFMKMLLNETRSNKYFYFSTFCATGFLLLSSVASKSYCEFSSICVFLFLGVLVKRARKYSVELEGDISDGGKRI